MLCFLACIHDVAVASFDTMLQSSLAAGIPKELTVSWAQAELVLGLHQCSAAVQACPAVQS